MAQGQVNDSRKSGKRAVVFLISQGWNDVCDWGSLHRMQYVTGSDLIKVSNKSALHIKSVVYKMILNKCVRFNKLSGRTCSTRWSHKNTQAALDRGSLD